MNWWRLYATLQIGFIVFVASATVSIFWAFVIAEICRFIFGLDENKALLLIGLPFLIILFSWSVRALPNALRKAGMLSDEPEKFGPWFKIK